MPVIPKILVTGANGQLGKELRKLSPLYPRFNFIFLSREDLPIHHFELLRNSFAAYHPQYCINCAAYTNVDKAETETELAFQINGEAVGVLAAICKRYDTKFIHISTDYVFDGTAGVPYKEDSVVNPVNAYGESKLVGEKQAIQFNPASIIIRCSWIYSEFGKNFVKMMLKQINEKNEISVVNDQVGSPTYAADLAEAILQIITFHTKYSASDIHGIYHFSNEGVISWYDFAIAMKELIHSNCKVNPILTSQYPTPAKRPHYSVLDKTKIQKIFGIQLKNWKDSLAVCIKKMRE
ncbi:MAG TPA: dTDP-4-dehydrorhamnose reductase [Chitinophagaceae bacterium]|nr:dTDP-4-dehydrorhamnose reductase [Chitinophagaceae bacterium]